MHNPTTMLEDLVDDEEGLEVLVDAVKALREQRSEPDATAGECLVAICRDWLFEIPRP